jgi:DNA primase
LVPRHPEALSAIKNAVDIVTLVGEYLPLRRSGNKYKALCPFHDDHNPSLVLNPERQSYKCWSCGAGGDIFDFVKNYERVEFPEALRMLAARAGVSLEIPSAAPKAPAGPSKAELFQVNAWAERLFADFLRDSPATLDYLAHRGLAPHSIERFGLGHAPEARGRLLAEAERTGFGLELLEQAGLVTRSAESLGSVQERFRGRLMFPIHDDRGRTVGFGGRILPDAERALAASGIHVAKYVNTPETALFHKRMLLYGGHLARTASRTAGWVALVEGYTDVIAAHQSGVGNVVGTLGTALSDDHLRGLRRLAERVVLVFDGDEAGQSAADRALELFLGSELDLRVLTLPADFDPCEFVFKAGGEAFRALAEQASDPLEYALERARARFDLDSGEGARRAAEWVLGILNRVPTSHRLGVELKQAKILDTLARRLRVPLETLSRMRRQLVRAVPRARATGVGAPGADVVAQPDAGAAVVRPLEQASRPATKFASEMDRTDLELIRIVLNEPSALDWLLPGVAVSALRDAPLRTILQAIYDLHREGQAPSYDNLMVRLDDPEARALAAGLVDSAALSTPDPAPLSERARPAPWQERLEKMLDVLAARERRAQLGDLRHALEQTDRQADPVAYRAIELEYQRLLTSGRARKN